MSCTSDSISVHIVPFAVSPARLPAAVPACCHAVEVPQVEMHYCYRGSIEQHAGYTLLRELFLVIMKLLQLGAWWA